MIEHEVQNKACAVVMDVKTGEILAMSTKPDFDPNSPNTIYDENVQAQLDAITDEDARQKARWRLSMNSGGTRQFLIHMSRDRCLKSLLHPLCWRKKWSV